MAMLQELSHMDRITQLQDEIQQVSPRCLSLGLAAVGLAAHTLFLFISDSGDHVQHDCIPYDEI